MAELAMRRFGASPEETAVVGDRIYTDIAGGVNAGVDSIFVLSGEGVPEDIERYGFQPTWIFATVADAADAIAAETEETAAAEYVRLLECAADMEMAYGQVQARGTYAGLHTQG